MGSFNWVIILAASAVPLLFGGIWYAKPFFESFTGENSSGRKHPGWVYGLCYLMGVPIAFTLSIFFLGHDDVERVWTHGVFHGSMLALMVAVPVLAVHFSFEGDRSFRNALYHLVYWTISISLMGAVIFGAS